MLTLARFAVIDDRKEHIEKIKSAFDVIGAPCLGVVFPDVKSDSLHGVRVLFVDLHLLPGSSASEGAAKNYAVILSILETYIDPDGGPYILVLWTSYPEERDALVRYIDERISPEKIKVKPISIIGLNKAEFFDLTDLKDKSTSSLHDKIMEHINSVPQLAALLNWEGCVGGASGRTLAALMDVLPMEERTAPKVSAALDALLSSLAEEAYGSHAEKNKYDAINAALSPLLVDCVLNQKGDENTEQIWERAITLMSGGKSAIDVAGKINKMIHLAVPNSEKMTATSWGAVIPLPSGWEKDDAMLAKFGLKLEDVMLKEFNINAEHREVCRPRLVRLGAACDYAQDKIGPIPYILCLEMPDYKNSNKPKEAEWKSPVLKFNGKDEAFVLKAHARLIISLLPKDVEGVKPLYRIREQLLMDLMAKVGSYTTRPGVFSMHSDQIRPPSVEPKKAEKAKK